MGICWMFIVVLDETEHGLIVDVHLVTQIVWWISGNTCNNTKEQSFENNNRQIWFNNTI